MGFVDDTTPFSNLDELSIIDAILLEKLRHDKGVIIIAIRKYLEAVSEGWQLGTFSKLGKHAPTGFLRPFADGKTGEEIRLSFYAGVPPLLTLLKPISA